MQRPKPLLDPYPAVSHNHSRSSRQPLRHSRNKRSPAPNSFTGTSSKLLALLVTVAGSSAVDARPLHESDIPPDFLCPRLHARSLSHLSSPSIPIQPSTSPYAAGPSSLFHSSSSGSQLGRPAKKRRRPNNNIADKFEQSPDGRWRKVDFWELYGSTSCALGTQCMDAIPTQVQDDSVSPIPPSASDISSSSTTSKVPTLPPGWDKHADTDGMTGVILGLSLLLALGLILLMVGVVLWRRKRRKDYANDAEKTPSQPNEEVNEDVRRARSHQRRWARVSAKWMANVRQSARKRRRRNAAVVPRDSDADLLDDKQISVQGSASAVSLTPTDNHSSTSRPRSIRSERTRIRSRSTTPTSSVRHRRIDSDAPPSSPYPPAYIPSPPTHQGSGNHSYPFDAQLNPSHTLGIPGPSAPGDLSLSPLPYEVHSAHVATDDKSVLARMASLASAPPLADQTPSDVPEVSSDMYPSVPILEDDGFEPLPPELEPNDISVDARHNRATRRASSSSLTHDGLTLSLEASSPYPYSRFQSDCTEQEIPSYAEDAIRHRTLIFPPPPPKLTLTGPTFYEFPSEFADDVANIDPPLGPSSPPFEDPSAPPFEYEEFSNSQGVRMIEPSAPPLEFAEQLPPCSDEVIPPAPRLDREPLHSSHGMVSDTGLPDVECSVSLSNPDDHGNVSPSEGAASPRLSIGHGEPSPPQYLP